MECTYCQRPTPIGLHLCEACADRLHATLNDLPDLLDELGTTAAKLDQVSAGGASRGSTTSASEPPARLDALMLAMEIREISMSWAFMLMENRAKHPSELHGAAPLDYLRRSVSEIRRHDFAGDMLDELTERASKAWRAIDIPRDVRILGRCAQQVIDDDGQIAECGGVLKTDGRRDTTVCPLCYNVYIVAEWDEWNRQRARGELMTQTEARRWLAERAGVTVKVQDLKNWMHQRMIAYVLARVTTEGRAVKLIYPGDVLAVHHRMQDRRRAVLEVV